MSKETHVADEIAALKGAIGKVEKGGGMIIEKQWWGGLTVVNGFAPSIKREIYEMLKIEKPEDVTIADELVSTKLLPIWKESLKLLQQQLKQLLEQRKKFLGSTR